MLSPTGRELLQEIIACNTSIDNPSQTEKPFIKLLEDHKFPIKARRDALLADNKSYTRLLFTSNRKRSAIILLKSGEHFLYTYGSGDIILSACTRIHSPSDEEVDLTPALVGQIRTSMTDSNQKSFRTLGIAYKKLPEGQYDLKHLGEPDKEVYSIERTGLTYIGFLGLQDPLRKGVPEAVETMTQAGVTVRMVTGDKKETAIAIAKECHILPKDDPKCLVMEGEEFTRLVGPLEYECKACGEKNKDKKEDKDDKEKGSKKEKNDASEVKIDIDPDAGAAPKNEDKKDDKEGKEEGSKKKAKKPCKICHKEMQPVVPHLDEFKKIVDRLRVIALCRPEDKYLLVISLKQL